ncbi:MAG: sugar phosphate isomerase/epimerase [Oscillospiraceae bacterium]
MKLAFSTLGCPDWTLGEIFSAAKDLSFDGVEIRGIGNEVYAPAAKPFQVAHIVKTREEIAAMGVPVVMLATGICLGQPVLRESNFTEANEYFALAKALDVSLMRVMIESTPQPERSDYAAAVEAYAQLCDEAARFGVCPLIETNGSLADSARMNQFMKDTAHPNSGVLWDIHHPFRFFDESPEKTCDRLAGLVKYVHVKDSRVENGKIVYKMLGYGDVPVREAVRALAGAGYDGLLSLEWVKRWCPELEDGGIVFSHFVNFMRGLK